MAVGKSRRRARRITIIRSEPLYPYPVSFRSPLFGSPGVTVKGGTMGVTTVIKDYGTEILNAIRDNDLKSLKSILEKNLKVDHKIAKLCVTDIKHRPTKKFACPLILAARQEDPRVMNYMLVKGTDPNFIHHTIYSSKRREIITALHIASDLGFYDTVETLLNANADCNIADHNQETALHIAVKKADRVMVRMMLSRGADPNILDKRGNAALHIATLYGHLQMVRALLKYDADVYQQGQWGAIPPQIAAKEGHIHLIQLFCSRDVGNINIKIACYPDKREKAPIHLAAENGHVQTVLTLLDQFEAEVNLKDSDGNTPLHCVVLNPYEPHRMSDEKYFTECARVMVKNRVSINEKNSFGDSALHLAAMNHFRHIVELLLEVGANPFAENDERLKPIDVVPDSDPVTKQLLKSAMLNPRPPVSASSLTLNKLGDMSFAQMPGRHSGGLGTVQENGGPFQTSTLRSNMEPPGSNLFPRNDPQNFSFRSVSSMSSVFVDEVHRQRLAAKQRQDQMAPSDPSLGQSNSGSSGSQPQQDAEGRNVYHQIDHENEIPVYTKVDKDKKHKHGSKTQQQSSNDTLQSMTKEEIMRSGPATVHAVNPWETNSLMSSMVSDDTSFDDHEPRRPSKQVPIKNKLDRRKQVVKQQQKEAYLEDDSNATEDVFQEEEDARKSRHKKDKRHRRDDRESDERIYQNVNIEPRQKGQQRGHDRAMRPLPPEPKDVQPYKQHDVRIQHPRQKPGTIEVQYSGGPITISVDTMMDEGMGNLPPGVGMGPLPPGLAEPKTPVLKEITSVADEDLEAQARKERKKKRKEKERDEMIYMNQDMMSQRRKDKHKSKRGHKVPEEDFLEEQGDLPPPLPHKRRDKPKGRYLYQNEHDDDAESNDLDQYVGADNADENEGTHYMNVEGKYGKAAPHEDDTEDSDEYDSDEEGVQDERYVSMEGNSPKKQEVSGIINGTMNLNETETHSEFSMESQPEPEEVRKTIKQKIEDMTGEYRKRWHDEANESVELPESWQNAEDDAQAEEQQPEDIEYTQAETPSKKKKKKKDKKHKNKHKEVDDEEEEKEEVEHYPEQPHDNQQQPNIIGGTGIFAPSSQRQHQYDDEFLDEPAQDIDLEEEEEEDDPASPQYRTFAEKKRLFAAMLAQQGDHETMKMEPYDRSKPKPKPVPRPRPAPRGSIKNRTAPDEDGDTEPIPYSSRKPVIIQSSGIFGASAEQISSQSEDSDADSESSSGDEEETEEVVQKAVEHPQQQHGEFYTIAPDDDADETSSNASSAQDTVINLVPNETRATEVHNEIKMERVRVVVTDVTHRSEIRQETTKAISSGKKEFPNQHESEQKEETHVIREKPPPGIVSPVNFKDILAMKNPPLSGSMSPSSFISDGSQSRLNLRVTGNVPKAYTRAQKDSARKAFMKAAPVGIESGSEASDSESLSSSQRRLGRNSRTSLTETSPPNPSLEGIRRRSEWNEPLQPIIGPTNHPLSPPPTSPPMSPPLNESPEDGKKAKLIGQYAKPYKSFGKIETNTDLIDEYMQDIPEEELGEYDPMRLHSEQEPFASYLPGGPHDQQSDVVRPQAVKFAQPSDESNQFQTVVSSPRKRSSEDRSSPVNASDQSAFSFVNQGTQIQEPALSPTPRGESIRSPKTVSIREENFNERGEKVETITTTVTTARSAQSITITAQDVLVDDDDDDEYFDDDSFDEDEELEDYSEEPGTKRGKKIKRPTERPPEPPTKKPEIPPKPVTVTDDEVMEEETLLKPSQIKAKLKQAQTEAGLHPSLFDNMEDFNNDPGMRRVSVPPRPKLPTGYKAPEGQSPERSPTRSLERNQSPDYKQYSDEPGQRKPRQKMHPEIVEMPEPDDDQQLAPAIESYEQEPGSNSLDVPATDAPQEQKSFGPEDEEVAEISAAADAKRAARKEKRRKKKEIEAAKAVAAAAEQAVEDQRIQQQHEEEQPVQQPVQSQQKQQQDQQPTQQQQQQQHHMSAQQNQNQMQPTQFQTMPMNPGQTDPRASQMGPGYHPGRAAPGKVGTTIFIDGQAEVTMLNSQGKPVVPKAQSKADEQNEKGGFLKFPSLRGKKKKKDKDKSTESLDSITGEEKKKKKKKKKDKSTDSIQQVEPGTQGVNTDVWKEAMSGQPLASSETRYNQTPVKVDITGSLPNSPGSPGEHGIHGTVMGANVDRGDTVKKGQSGAYSRLKRAKAPSVESLDEDDPTCTQQSAQEQALLAAQGKIGSNVKHAKQHKPGADTGLVADMWSQQQGNQQGPQPGDIGYRGHQAHDQQQPYHHPTETNLDDDLPPIHAGYPTQAPHGQPQHGQFDQSQMGVIPQETDLDELPPNQQQFQDAALGQIQTDLQQQPKRQMGRRAMGGPKGPRGQQQLQDQPPQTWVDQQGQPMQPFMEGNQQYADPHMHPQGMDLGHGQHQQYQGTRGPAVETNIDDDLPPNAPGQQPMYPIEAPQHPDPGMQDPNQQFQDAALGAIVAQQQQPRKQMGRRAARQAQGNRGAPAGFPGSSQQPQPQVTDLWAEAQRKQEAFVQEEELEQEMMQQARRDVDARLGQIGEEPMDTEELRPTGDMGPPDAQYEGVTPQPFSRSEPARKSGGRRRGRRHMDTEPTDQAPNQQPIDSFENAAMASVQSNLQQQRQPPRQRQLPPEDDAEALSKMWKQRKDQEAEMTRVLKSMSDPEMLDELPPGHQRPGQHGAGPQELVKPQYPKGGPRVTLQTPPGSPKPAKPPKPKKPQYLKGRPDKAPGGDPNVQSFENAAMNSISSDLKQQHPQGPPRRSSQGRPSPGPQGFLPGTYKPPPPMYTGQRGRQGSQGRQDDSQLVSDMWAQQNKAEVVEMPPQDQHNRRNTSSSSLPREGQHGGRPRSGRPRGPRGPGQDPRRHHSSADVQSDTEAMHTKRKNKSISFSEIPGGRRRSRDRSGHHSETEMQNYEPPRVQDPGKSLQEAALESIQAGLKDQKKITPRRTLPDKKKPINYTRGVYRPNPVVWRGSMGGSRSASTSSRYDDSQIISQLWAERGQTDTEGEADTEDISGYHGDYSRGDDSYMEGPPGQMMGQMPMGTPAGGQHPGPNSSTPEENKENAGHHHHQQPRHGGPHGLPPVPQSPRRVTIQDQSRRRKKKRRHEKPDLPPQITEPGPVDFSKYSDTAKLWMEQVDQNTVKKSKTMYLSVMPEGKSLPEEFTSRVPKDKEGDPSHQWVIARGRSIRQKKRKMEEARRRSQGGASDYNTSGAESDWDNDRPMSPGKQLLIFFRVGGNWRDLAWVLFDGIQSDAETIRMTKDVELKHPDQLTDQVHDLMLRWWKKKGSDATIEELQRALGLVNMIYVQEEYVHQGQYGRPSVTSFTDTEEELDISQIYDDDPDVSRLIQEYNVRSLNASFDVSGAALKQHLLENHPGIKADSLSKKLYGTGLVETGSASAHINRDRMESSRDSLGRKGRGSGGFPDASQDPLDYDSDTGRKHSFVIVQPQLKSEDYKHETAI